MFAKRFSISSAVLLFFCLVGSSALCDAAPQTDQPIVEPALVFEEIEGTVAVEAEHFFRQDKTEKRAFHITTPEQHPKASSDGDDVHWNGASGNAYLEILPDTRRNHDEKLERGVNFSNEPGKLAVVQYKVHFNNPGRYYVWVRAYSTGSEDNGLHVGINGTWPEHGKRMQWCDGKNSWRWESKQRTKEVHCGVPHEIYLDVPTAGQHTISFSMREDGFEFDRWLMTTDRDMKRPSDAGPDSKIKSGDLPKQFQVPRVESGDGKITVSGELKKWHTVTLSQSGPFAYETDDQLGGAAKNPFTDYRMDVTFTHAETKSKFKIPGYFAADGDAAESSAKSGNVWRCHFCPNQTGTWNYEVAFVQGTGIAFDVDTPFSSVETCNAKKGSFKIQKTVAENSNARVDLRTRGMLLPNERHHLVFGETKKPFFKVGPDAPETLLGYHDFDGTRALNPKKCKLKSWQPHVQDWRPGDPTWKSGTGNPKGKGIIGAINYLSDQGLNAMSLLTYNVDGDGGNVWPYVAPRDKMHFDCSKLDQWKIVLEHAQAKGLMVHIKLQETENDDHRGVNGEKQARVRAALDGGRLGPARRLYIRELVARFGHLNGLEWNIGEENTQSHSEQLQMAAYLRSLDAYNHNLVLHTYPQQQDKKYEPWLGKRPLSGVSLQNMWNQVHKKTLHWIRKSDAAGRPWIVANDEQNQADQGVPPDPGYGEFDGTVTMKNGKTYDLHDIRKQTLWGNLMAGGAGVMYYFGYKLPENDLACEDFRSREQSWSYCRIAKDFIETENIPLDLMSNQNALVGNTQNDSSVWCLAKTGQIYLVYLPAGGDAQVDLSAETVEFDAFWFDPRNGGALQPTAVANQKAVCNFSSPGKNDERTEDWLLVLKKR